MVVQVFTSADTYLRSLLLLLLHVIARFFISAKTPLTLPVFFSPKGLFLSASPTPPDLVAVKISNFRVNRVNKRLLRTGGSQAPLKKPIFNYEQL